MIDCGEGAQRQMRRSRLSFSRLNHIFISHLHGDHCFGLPGLISTFSLLGRTAPLHIYAPQKLEELMLPWLHYFCHGISFSPVFHPITPENGFSVIYEDRSVTVYSFPLNHRIPCCGFLFREKATLHHIRRDMIDFLNIPVCEINNIKNGADWTTPDGKFFANNRLVYPADPPRSYAYCSDTAPLPENAEILQGIDLLFHESTFAESEILRAAQTFHSTARQAAEFARQARVKQLLIGHYSSRYNDESTLLDEARNIFPNTLAAKENMKIVL